MRRLLLFAKRPVLGAVKTRLAPLLSPEECLVLYRAFLDDQIRFLRSFAAKCEIELCLDGPPEGMEPPSGMRLSEQGAGDLGQRMLRAFQRCWRHGVGAAAILGADAPTLPAAFVHEALTRLEAGADAVLVPAEDGGYVLVGMRRPLAELFRDIPWGTGDVLEATRSRAREAAVDLQETATWYDVDDGAGLSRLCAELGRGEAVADRASATARALASLGLGPASGTRP